MGLTGRLLVASPLLVDPNFERTVVLVLDHGEPGALGVVLNRPTEVPVKAVLEQWDQLAASAPPSNMFRGGPVARDAIIGLGKVMISDLHQGESIRELSPFAFGAEDELGEPVDEGQSGAEGDGQERIGVRDVLVDIDTVDLSISPDAQPYVLDGIRLFSGYAGWGGSQLEGEIAEGAWFVVEARADDIFVSEPDLLWRDVLRRQKTNLAVLAAYPPDPSSN